MNKELFCGMGGLSIDTTKKPSDVFGSTELTSAQLAPLVSEDDIDYNYVYALFTFIATLEGQLGVAKGEALVLLDDSNSYWWLVKGSSKKVGYVPAENIETPFERLARLNRSRNVELAIPTPADNIKVIRGNNSKSIRFDMYHTEIYADNVSDDDAPPLPNIAPVVIPERQSFVALDDQSSNQSSPPQKGFFKKLFSGKPEKKQVEVVATQKNVKPVSAYQPGPRPVPRRNPKNMSVAQELHANAAYPQRIETPQVGPVVKTQQSKEDPAAFSQPLKMGSSSSNQQYVRNESTSNPRQPAKAEDEMQQVLRIYADSPEFGATFKTVVFDRHMNSEVIVRNSLKKFRMQNRLPEDYYLYIVLGDSKERALAPQENLLSVLLSLKDNVSLEGDNKIYIKRIASKALSISVCYEDLNQKKIFKILTIPIGIRSTGLMEKCIEEFKLDPRTRLKLSYLYQGTERLITQDSKISTLIEDEIKNNVRVTFLVKQDTPTAIVSPTLEHSSQQISIKIANPELNDSRQSGLFSPHVEKREAIDSLNYEHNVASHRMSFIPSPTRLSPPPSDENLAIDIMPLPTLNESSPIRKPPGKLQPAIPPRKTSNNYTMQSISGEKNRTGSNSSLERLERKSSDQRSRQPSNSSLERLERKSSDQRSRQPSSESQASDGDNLSKLRKMGHVDKSGDQLNHVAQSSNGGSKSNKNDIYLMSSSHSLERRASDKRAPEIDNQNGHDRMKNTTENIKRTPSIVKREKMSASLHQMALSMEDSIKEAKRGNSSNLRAPTAISNSLKKVFETLERNIDLELERQSQEMLRIHDDTLSNASLRRKSLQKYPLSRNSTLEREKDQMDELAEKLNFSENNLNNLERVI
jgi:hypothetical protein